MKIAVKAKSDRYYKYQPEGDFSNIDLVFFPKEAPDSEIIDACPDAEVLCVDAIAHVSAELIAGLPNLKMIQSDGVGYNGIDVQAATKRGVLVCNNAGINAKAVAEQTILLILGLLRTVIPGHNAVFAGRQIETKERLMFEGIRELADCTVGIIGLGNIGIETARLLKAFGCEVMYYSRHRKPDVESELGITYATQEELVRQCDIVSLHCLVTPETTNMVNKAFLAAMKNDALLINTGRGDLVDNAALAHALEEGSIGGAGIDTLAPEPVMLDNPLLNMSDEAKAKLLISPHIGGITSSTFKRGFENVWGNFVCVRDGIRPKNIVNEVERA